MQILKVECSVSIAIFYICLETAERMYSSAQRKNQRSHLVSIPCNPISDCCLDSIHRVSATLNDTNKIPVTHKEEVIIITLFLCRSSLIKSRSIFSCMLRQCVTILQYAACLFQVQRHAGLRALVLPRTMAESIEPNVLRIMPLLLQCRGDASLSMVSITFIGLARGECTFKPDVIPTLEMHFNLSHTAAFPYFVFC